MITAPESQGYTQGLRTEGPRLTRSHKGSLFLMFFILTKPQRVPTAHTEAQAHKQCHKWTHRGTFTQRWTEVIYRHNPRGYQSYMLDPRCTMSHMVTQVTDMCTQS